MSTPSTGQSLTTGDIVGVVTDATGAVAIKATVTLKSNEKGFRQTSTTSAEGAYWFPLLAPGSYTVATTVRGFEATSRVVTVSVGQTSSVDIRLKVGSTNTTVAVTAAEPLLQTENADGSTVFNASQIANLPNPGNDLTNVAQTAPGAVMNTQSGTGNFSTYGLPATSNQFTLDGINENDPVANTNIVGAAGLTLGLNEVQEATVVNNGYSGQYGGFAGANVNYVTKSGSNSFHGNAAYWWNGRALDANDWFNKDVQPGTPVTPRPFENANQYAASLGGPVKKNKAFFFVDYEGLRLILPISFGTLTLIPSPQFEAATVANLASTGHSASIPFYQQMFSLWNGAPGAERAVPGNPQVGDSTGCNGFTGPGGLGSTTPCALSFRSTANSFTHEYLLAGRFDFDLGEKDKFFVRLREDRGVQANYIDKINPIFNRLSDVPIYQGQVSHSHVFNAETVNLLILSAKYESFTAQPADLASALAAFPTNLFFGDGTFSFLGGLDAFSPTGVKFTSYQILDDFTLSAGNHALKFGLNFNRVDLSNHEYGLLSGLITPFTVADFFAGGKGPVGDSLMQNFTATRVEPLALYGLGFYGQDNWRVKRNLHLTFSFRLDHSSNPVCQRNCFARLARPFNELNHVVNIPYNQAIVTGLHRAWPSFTGLVWQPRFGFAWTPSRLKNTVFSGGLGLFGDSLAVGNLLVNRLTLNPPIVNSFTIYGDNLAPTEPANLFKDAANSDAAFLAGFSSNGTLASITASDPLFTPPNVINTVDTKSPRYQEWNFRVQQGFGVNTSVSLNYVGNHGIFIPILLDGVNAYCPPSAPPGPACPGGFIGLPASAPDPRFSVVTEIHSAGVSTYNGLVVSFQHRFAKGFQVQANYTWSHALDEVSNGGLLSAFNNGAAGSLLSPQDSSNLRKYSYGNADYDTRHYFSASYVWELPYKSGPVALLKGWQVSGTIFARSGFPYTVLDSLATNILSAFNYGDVVYANFLGTSYPGCSSPKQVCLDESQFSSPALQVPAGFGAQRRGQFYGPGFFDTDLAIMKETKIPGWEGTRLGVGALFFNLFNHPNFDQPNQDIGTPSTFGRITGTATPPTSVLGAGLTGDAAPRLIQLTARITF